MSKLMLPPPCSLGKVILVTVRSVYNNKLCNTGNLNLLVQIPMSIVCSVSLIYILGIIRTVCLGILAYSYQASRRIVAYEQRVNNNLSTYQF